METKPLSDADFDLMAQEVDQQLLALRAAPEASTRAFKAAADEPSMPDAPAQRQVVEEAAGEPFETFWEKYRRHLQKDLCLPGGLLHDQWKTFQDLASKDTVKVSYGVLAGLGLSGASLSLAAVAISVFVLNVALKVGIDAFCEDCVKESQPS